MDAIHIMIKRAIENSVLKIKKNCFWKSNMIAMDTND